MKNPFRKNKKVEKSVEEVVSEPVVEEKVSEYNCPLCSGSGLKNQFEVCPKCQGTGKV